MAGRVGELDARTAVMAAIENASDPFSVVTAELKELESSLSLPPSPGQLGDLVTLEVMRRKLDAAVQAVAHEVSRFGLVLMTPPVTRPAVTSACWALVESVQNCVSALQLLTHSVESCGVLDAASVRLCSGLRGQETGAVGQDVGAGTLPSPASTFGGFYRSVGHSLLRILSQCVKTGAQLTADTATDGAAGTFKTSRVDASLARSCKTSFLNVTGMAMKVTAQFKGLPATPVSAVRRRLLLLAKLLKVSAAEVREAHAGSAGAAGRAGGEGQDAALAALAAIDTGVAVLRCLAGATKTAMDACEAAVQGAGASTDASVLALSGSGAAGAHVDLASAPCLDALSNRASALHDVVVDLAAALNELGDAEAGGEDDEEEEEEEGGDGGGHAGARQDTTALFRAQADTLSACIPPARHALAGLLKEASRLLPVMEPALAGALEGGIAGAGQEAVAALAALERGCEQYRAALC